jgi:hypothetical protein
MKFALAWTNRQGGSPADNVGAMDASVKLLASWQPNPDHEIHQWVQRCDGDGGFCVLDTDNAAALYKDLAAWGPWIDFRVYPVLDIGESTPLMAEAAATARSVI